MGNASLDDVREQLRNEVAEEQASKDAFFKKVWDDLQGFRRKYDIWEAHAFLPRAQN